MFARGKKRRYFRGIVAFLMAVMLVTTIAPGAAFAGDAGQPNGDLISIAAGESEDAIPEDDVSNDGSQLPGDNGDIELDDAQPSDGQNDTVPPDPGIADLEPDAQSEIAQTGGEESSMDDASDGSSLSLFAGEGETGVPDTDWYTANPGSPTYTINTADELAGLAQIVNGTAVGVPAFNFSGRTISLGADIDLSVYGDPDNDNPATAALAAQWNDGKGWIPIGELGLYYNYEEGDYLPDPYSGFGGIFDGAGHTISGLYINDEQLWGAGLFGNVATAVKNINITEAKITSGIYAGVISGSITGSITNCIFEGIISGSANDATRGGVGGIAGHVTGNIVNCTFKGSVSGSVNYTIGVEEVCVGGIAGYAYGSIADCSFSGTVNSSGDEFVCAGGIAGYVYGSISNCSFSGTVSGTSENGWVGGIAGDVYGRVEGCHSMGTVDGFGEYIGGIAGAVGQSGIVKNSYSTCNVEGNGSYGSIGGVAGAVIGIVTNAYSTGTIINRSEGGTTGGITGRVYYDGHIENCAALNPSVISTMASTYVGRVAGEVYGIMLSGNVAYQGMGLTIGGLPKTPTSSLNGVDGANRTSSELQSASGFPWDVGSEPWTYASEKLPGLSGQSVDMPRHLLDGYYPLTVVGGSGSAGSGAYEAGEVVEIYAGIMPSGFLFAEWENSGGGVLANVTSESTTFTMPSSAVTLTASFGLDPLASITGIVTDNDGAPLAGILVSLMHREYDDEDGYIYSSSERYIEGYGYVYNSAVTNGEGYYTINAVEPGTHYVGFFTLYASTAGYMTAYYGLSGTTNARPGDAFVKVDGEAGIADAQLQKGGSIEGRVTGKGGAGVEEATIDAFTWCYVDQYDEYHYWRVGQTSTNKSGEYEIGDLPPGDIYLVVYPNYKDTNGYLATYYGNGTTKPGEKVTVQAGGVSTGIDISMANYGKVTGKLSNANGEMLPGLLVEAVSMANPNPNRGNKSDITDGSGTFAIENLMPGQYTLRFRKAGSDANAASEYYEQYLGAPNFEDATTFSAEQNQTVTKDFVVYDGDSIAGEVQDIYGEGIGGILVEIYRSDRRLFGVITNPDGSYTLNGLLPDDYRILYTAGDERRYTNAWYDGTEYGSDSMAKAALIPVVKSQAKTLSAIKLLEGYAIKFNEDEEETPECWVYKEDAAGVYRQYGNFRTDIQELWIEDEEEWYTSLIAVDGLPEGNYKLAFIWKNNEPITYYKENHTVATRLADADIISLDSTTPVVTLAELAYPAGSGGRIFGEVGVDYGNPSNYDAGYQVVLWRLEGGEEIPAGIHTEYHYIWDENSGVWIDWYYDGWYEKDEYDDEWGYGIKKLPDGEYLVTLSLITRGQTSGAGAFASGSTVHGGGIFFYSANVPGGVTTDYGQATRVTISGGSIVYGINIFPLAGHAVVGPEGKVFSNEEVGYQDIQPQEFTVRNTGTETLSGLTAAFDNSGSSAFEITGGLPAVWLSSSQTVTVSVRPKNGLWAGTHKDTLRITGSGGFNLAVHLSFTVNEPVYKAFVSPTNKDFESVVFGYGEQGAQAFTVYNSGTGTLTGLSAALGGVDADCFEMISGLSAVTLAPKGTASVSVRPKTGLPAEEYTGAYLLITGDSGVSLSVPLTFIVAPKYTGRDIEKGKDNFRFLSKAGDFFNYGGLRGTYRELLKGDYYDALQMATSSPQDWDGVEFFIDKLWSDGDFGMAAVAALTKAGDLSPGFFQQGAEKLYDLKAPKESESTAGLVTYYNMLQYTQRAIDALEYTDDDAYNCGKIVKAMQSSAYPVMIGLDMVGSPNRFVVGYDISETAPYDIKIWDPYSPESPSNTLRIDEDPATGTLSNGGFLNDNAGGVQYNPCLLKFALTVESGNFDFLNLQSYLSGLAGYEPLGIRGLAFPGRGGLSAASETNATSIVTNYGDFTITGSGGSVTVSDGKAVSVSGSFDVTDGVPIFEKEGERYLRFVVPTLSEGEAYTLAPSGPTPGGGGFETSVCYGSITDGFSSRVITGTAGDFIFEADGAVSVDFGGAAHEATLQLTRNKVVCGLYKTSVTATDSSFLLAPSLDPATLAAAAFSGDGSGVATVGLSGGYNSLFFENIPTTFGFTVKEYNGEIVLIDGSDIKIEGGAVGHSVVFITGGGTAYEALTNIPYGDTIEPPGIPVKAGHTFGGWYSDAGYGTPWDFTTPITENMRLYARWAANRYAVTYNANGGKFVGGSLAGEKTVKRAESFGADYAAGLGEPERAGYRFLGWNTAKDVKKGSWAYRAGERPKASKATILKNHTVYAIWQQKDGAIFLNENYGGAQDEYFSHIKPGKALWTNGKPTAPVARPGFTFGGWYKKNAAGVLKTKVTDKTKMSGGGSVTLYAKWTAKKVTVTMNLNQKSVSPSKKNTKKTTSVKYGSSYAGLAIPALAGARFVKWTADPEGLWIGMLQ